MAYWRHSAWVYLRGLPKGVYLRGLPTVAGAMLLECEGDDAALAELGITSRLAVGKLRSSLRALAARR